ncbi:dihydroxyacetone kinase phosphoryl donor subunit DhaM [Thermopolyspora sp. NPDC052614]|uniref:dihydroxyacetone kinase phosphoryl donor subunit DhaM n=1 Tax=Thermopolyspora sp. NPDC052614 TaxID=3155682 RepID=UPI0034365026
MVGIVLVSHSLALALEVANLARRLAPERALVCAAGGTLDGSLGTSIDRVRAAVEAADQGEGVVLLADLGSSVITARLLVEDLGDERVVLADAPLVEGAVAAAVMAGAGAPLADVVAAAEQARTTGKL